MLFIKNVFKLSFSLKKILVAFPLLFACSLLFSLSYSFAIHTTNWFFLSLLIFPILISGALLLSLGFFLTKTYSYDRALLHYMFLPQFLQSFKRLWKISYLFLPLAFLFIAKKLLVILLLGLLSLLKHFHILGPGTEAILDRLLPLLLVFGLSFLGLVSLLSLYFFTPKFALAESLEPIKIIKETVKNLLENVVFSLSYFILSLLPAFLLLLLYLWLPLNGFVSLLIFSLLMTPCVIFFFNASYESHHILTFEKAE